MGGGRAADSPQCRQDGPPGIGSAVGRQRYFLASLDGCSLARSARAFPTMATVYGHFSRWRRDGVFARIVEALQIKLDKDGLIDWDIWCVDGANVRAAWAAGGADKKVSNATPTSLRTTLWAAAEAGLDRSSTWLLTARELRLPLKSRPDR